MKVFSELLRVGLFLRLVAWLLLAGGLAGCQLPEGSSLQSSVVGLKLAPFGDAPTAPQMIFGSSTSHYSQMPRSDVGPLLNRTQVKAPFGLDQTSTLAAGPVGEQFREGGPVMAETIRALHPPEP